MASAQAGHVPNDDDVAITSHPLILDPHDLAFNPYLRARPSGGRGDGFAISSHPNLRAPEARLPYNSRQLKGGGAGDGFWIHNRGLSGWQAR
jgi:hypothetical protein